MSDIRKGGFVVFFYCVLDVVEFFFIFFNCCVVVFRIKIMSEREIFIRVKMGYIINIVVSVVVLIVFFIFEVVVQLCLGVNSCFQFCMGFGYWFSLFVIGFCQFRYIIIDSVGNFFVVEGGFQLVRCLVFQDQGNIVCVQFNIQFSGINVSYFYCK